ncbi:MAG: glycosyltransferase [Candidatus Phytoplasma sp. TWB_XP]
MRLSGGIPIPFKHFKGYRFILRYKKYFSQIKDLNLDIIHIHSGGEIGKLGIYTRNKLNIPAIYTMHSFYELLLDNNKLFKLFKGLILKKIIKMYKNFISQTNLTVVLTLKTLQYLETKYKIKGNYEIIPTQLNLKQFYSESHSQEKIQNLKTNLGLKDSFVCLFVGRLSKEKEIHYLMDAFASFYKKHPQSKFLIIGDGPERKHLENQAKKLNISDSVVFLGFIANDNVGFYYNLGTVFLNASLYETQGLTYIEALAASLPVVARYDIVLENVITNDKNGFFYHQKEELINYLSLLYNDNKKTKTMSMNAKNSILNYDQTSFAFKMIQIYKEAIKTNKEKNNQNNNHN